MTLSELLSIEVMLSKQILSISLSIVSEMTENPTAKYVKFCFRATLLIDFRRSSVIVSVVCKLAVLQFMHLFRISVISVKKKVATEIQEEFTEKKNITRICS